MYFIVFYNAAKLQCTIEGTVGHFTSSAINKLFRIICTQSATSENVLRLLRLNALTHQHDQSGRLTLYVFFPPADYSICEISKIIKWHPLYNATSLSIHFINSTPRVITITFIFDVSLINLRPNIRNLENEFSRWKLEWLLCFK